MDKNLERILKIRVKVAKEKKLFEKGEVIATYLGHLATFEKGGHDYLENSISVESNEDERSVEVFAERKIVFSAEYDSFLLMLDINSYIPGEWEEEFEGLYKKAERKRKKTIGNGIGHLYGLNKRELKKKFGLK